MPPRIPGVELGEVIGRGGNAVVYSGVQTSVRRPVAVKVESRAISQDRNRRRFLREASTTGRISSHPHVVSLIDVGTTEDDHPYLVMELCEGGSVAGLLKRTGPLPVVDALDIGIAITGALVAAHEAGILHRDVKPGNILIDAYGTPRLSDFGLAAMLTTEEAFSATVEALTPAYAAPEVFGREVPTALSDVYAMGATIYAMLVGGAPRRREDGSSPSIAELFAALPERLPMPAADGADAVMPVLWRATAYNQSERYQSAADLRADLIQVRDRLGPSTGRVGGPEVTVIGLGELPSPPLVPAAAAGAAMVTAPPNGPVQHGAPAGGAPAGGAPMPATSVTRAGPARPVRRRRGWRMIALGVVVGALVGVALAWGLGSAIARWSSAASSSSSLETEGVTDGDGAGDASSEDPAARSDAESSLDDALAAPDVGTCWGGMVVIGGNVSAEAVGCESEHYWETYASGVLDPATASAKASTVATDPNVLATCTEQALAGYLASEDVAGLTWDVIPPSEAAFLAGERGFSCVASPEGGATTSSLRDAGKES